MARNVASNRTATRWTARIVPLIIACTFVLATYAFVGELCVRYLYRERHRPGLTAALLALYFLLFLPALASYARVFFAIQRDPGLVSLLGQANPSSAAEARGEKRKGPKSSNRRDLESRLPYTAPDLSPNSPGLEAFYSKDVFACEADGRPRWCSSCAQWKPDRAHHSSELERCVRKMDHLCPWVGGMVSETSFNFFSHFVFYTTCLCTLCLSTSAYCLNQQLENDQHPPDGWTIAVLALSAFFGLFAFGMTLHAARFIFTNTTNIDLLRTRQTFTLAVRIPSQHQPSPHFRTVTYPLQHSVSSAPAQDGPATPPAENAAKSRDVRATRTFAILRAEPAENPWNLGLWENWKSVMGTNIFEWLLPLRHSPCCNHESMTSDYPYGPLVDELRKRYCVPDLEECTLHSFSNSSDGGGGVV